MELSEAIRQRYSCRRYADRGVNEDTLRRIFELVRWAPSANNFQEWRFIVVRDAETRAQLKTIACNQAFVAQAPVVIACCGEKTDHVMTCGQPAYPIDVSIAIDHLTLVATDLGLATCWIGAFHEDQAKQLLGVPDHVRIVDLLTLGYPADSPGSKERLSVGEIVRYERW